MVQTQAGATLFSAGRGNTPPAGQRAKNIAIANEKRAKPSILARPVDPPKTATTPLHDIRLKCLECSGGNALEVRECQLPHCDLYPWRFGRRPEVEGRKKRTMTDEQKEKMNAARKTKKNES